MSLRYDGTRISVDKSNVDFTVFSNTVGTEPYDTNCNTSWYTHFTLGTICPNYDQLFNNAPDPGTIFADGFESGNLISWPDSSP
jgi:hypothetical protein